MTVPGSARAQAEAFDLALPPHGYFDDPAATFRLLRDHDPLHRNRDGSLLLTRYEDVRTIWRDLSGTVDKYEQFRARFGDGPLTEYHGTNMLFSDPPRHDRLRVLLNPFFMPKTLERLRTSIDARVDELLDEVEKKSEVDFVSDYALRLPTDVICMMIGLPREDGPWLHELAERVVNPLNPNHPREEMPAGHAATSEFMNHLRPHLDVQRAMPAIDPGASVIAALAHAEREGREISETEILHSCMLMFIGGHGTTMNMLGASLHFLLENSAQMADLKANPGILDGAVEELIRFVSPTQLQGRRTTRPVEIASGSIKEGTEIVLCPASANRDETVFADPDRLDLRRNPNPHIAFGAGVHFCIGRPLVKLELRSTLTKMLARFDRIERTGDARWRPLPRFRSLDTLPVRFYS
ncbi:MAG: cytochrome P450 [Rhizobiaceae bacterium]